MALLCCQGDGAFYCFQIIAQFPVLLGSKAFQVDVRGIDQRKQFLPRGFPNGAIGHQHVDHAFPVNQGGAVPDVLMTDQRLIVGIGNPNCPARR